VSRPKPSLRGVLLDVDGTLIDSNDAHAEAWVTAFREFGFEVEFARVRPLVGMGGDQLLPKLTGLDHRSERAAAITARRAEIFKTRHLHTLRAFPGAHELLARFKQDELKLVIATSSGEKQLNDMLEQTGLEDLVERKTSSSDAGRSKPAPDIVNAALERVHLEADEVLMLGDTPYDIEAAARAGVGTVAVRSGGWPDHALSGAVEIFDDAAELLREYERSPFARA
jgi:HAD superfamily hydrolase (TIGR01509 family)